MQSLYLSADNGYGNPGGGQALRKKERNGYRMGFFIQEQAPVFVSDHYHRICRVILAGSLLLMLPCSTREAGGASFTDALFTSTSAVCVTGLVVHDTVTYWSLFGQAVILVLIQIGGMGVVTVSGICRNHFGEKDRTDAAKYDAGSNFRTADGRNHPSDGLYHTIGHPDRADRRCRAGHGILQGIRDMEGNLVFGFSIRFRPSAMRDSI